MIGNENIQYQIKIYHIYQQVVQKFGIFIFPCWIFYISINILEFRRSVEFVSWSKLDDHWKLESIEWLFRSCIGFLSSAHRQSHTWNSNPGPIDLACKRLTCRPLSWHSMMLVSNFNQYKKLCNRPLLSEVDTCSYLTWISFNECPLIRSLTIGLGFQ